MNLCLSLCSEGEWTVSGCSLYRIFCACGNVCVIVCASQCNMASRKRKTTGFRTEEELADAVNEIANYGDSDR